MARINIVAVDDAIPYSMLSSVRQEYGRDLIATSTLVQSVRPARHRTMERRWCLLWRRAYGGCQHYKDRDMTVIGAGNAAAQGILFLARYARCVNVLIRGSEPTWSKYLDVAIRSNPKTSATAETA